MAKLALNNLTDEEIATLRKMGFGVSVEWDWKCPYCGHKILNATSQEACDKRIAKHLRDKCRCLRFWRSMGKLLPSGDCEGGELVYVFTGKFPKGYQPRTKNAAMLKKLRAIIKAHDKEQET